MLTRRQFGPGALTVGALGFSDPAAYDYASRQTFDHFERIFREAGAPGRPTETNERGRLAWGASYVRNLATTGTDNLPTTFARLDGSGGPVNAEASLQAPRWMAVAPWDKTVFTHARSIYDARAVQPAQGAYPGSYLACMAYLNWFARRS